MMEYSEFYYVDNLLRAALHGTKDDVLRAVRVLNRADEISAYDIRSNADVEYFVRHILIHRGDSEALAAFGKLYNETRKGFFMLSYEEANRFTFQLMSACLFGDDDLLRQVIGGNLLMHGVVYYSCLDIPVYILMLCGKYEFFAEQMKKLSCLNDEINLGDMTTLKKLFLSAAAFRDGRALKIMFENLSGTAFIDYISELARFPDSIAYLVENFYMYMGFEGRTEPPTLKEFFGAEHMCGVKVLLLLNSYRPDEKEMFNYYIERISPVSVMYTFDCVYFRIAVAVNDNKMLQQMFAEKVTVMCRQDDNTIPISECRRLLKGHKLTFDLSCAHNVNLAENTAEELRYLLVHGVNFPVSEGFCPFTEQLLDRGSRRIISLMISKGIINKDNYADAAAFLARQKKLEGLDELNKAVF